jgi:hypothetical protein
MIGSSHPRLSCDGILTFFTTGSQITPDEDNDSGYADGGEQEPLHGVPEMRALRQIWQLDRLKAALLFGLHGKEADIARLDLIGQRDCDGV